MADMHRHYCMSRCKGEAHCVSVANATVLYNDLQRSEDPY